MITSYSCYFFGPHREIAGRHDFRATSDTEAIATAKTLSLGHKFELWEGPRCIHNEAAEGVSS